MNSMLILLLSISTTFSLITANPLISKANQKIDEFNVEVKTKTPASFKFEDKFSHENERFPFNRFPEVGRPSIGSKPQPDIDLHLQNLLDHRRNVPGGKSSSGRLEGRREVIPSPWFLTPSRLMHDVWVVLAVMPNHHNHEKHGLMKNIPGLLSHDGVLEQLFGGVLDNDDNGEDDEGGDDNKDDNWDDDDNGDVAMIDFEMDLPPLLGFGRGHGHRKSSRSRSLSRSMSPLSRFFSGNVFHGRNASPDLNVKGHDVSHLKSGGHGGHGEVPWFVGRHEALDGRGGQRRLGKNNPKTKGKQHPGPDLNQGHKKEKQQQSPHQPQQQQKNHQDHAQTQETQQRKIKPLTLSPAEVVPTNPQPTTRIGQLRPKQTNHGSWDGIGAGRSSMQVQGQGQGVKKDATAVSRDDHDKPTVDREFVAGSKEGRTDKEASGKDHEKNELEVVGKETLRKNSNVIDGMGLPSVAAKVKGKSVIKLGGHQMAPSNSQELDNAIDDGEEMKDVDDGGDAGDVGDDEINSNDLDLGKNVYLFPNKQIRTKDVKGHYAAITGHESRKLPKLDKDVDTNLESISLLGGVYERSKGKNTKRKLEQVGQTVENVVVKNRDKPLHKYDEESKVSHENIGIKTISNNNNKNNNNNNNNENNNDDNNKENDEIKIQPTTKQISSQTGSSGNLIIKMLRRSPRESNNKNNLGHFENGDEKQGLNNDNDYKPNPSSSSSSKNSGPDKRMSHGISDNSNRSHVDLNSRNDKLTNDDTSVPITKNKREETINSKAVVHGTSVETNKKHSLLGDAHREIPVNDKINNDNNNDDKNDNVLTVDSRHEKEKDENGNQKKTKVKAEDGGNDPVKHRKWFGVFAIDDEPDSTGKNLTHPSGGRKRHRFHQGAIGLAILGLMVGVVVAVACTVSWASASNQELRRVNSRTAIYSPSGYYDDSNNKRHNFGFLE